MARRNDRTTRSSARSMIPTSDYHGAHKPTALSRPLDRWESERCVAFMHDLMSAPTLPPEFADVDVLFAEPPWQKGFGTFNERAAVDDGRTYAAFISRLGEIIESATAPTYVVTGRHALPRFPTPDAQLPMMLYQDQAVVAAYRTGTEAETNYESVPEFIAALAQRYGSVGDFCAGYGRTGRFFLRAGGRAVLTDYNPLCIGYIADHAPDWAAP